MRLGASRARCRRCSFLGLRSLASLSLLALFWCQAAHALASSPAATATPAPSKSRTLPGPGYNLAHVEQYALDQQHSLENLHQHERRRPTPMPAPMPAQFWAGWPKETVTRVRTVTLTGDGSNGRPGNSGAGGIGVTVTADETTTMYDSNMPTSGTLTVWQTTTVPVAGGQGEGTGTTTRTRTATVETRLPTAVPWTQQDIPRFAECLPGDEKYRVPGVLSLTKEQKDTMIAIPIMFVVILVGWNFVIVRYLFYPLKMWVLLVHEAGHVIGGVAMGARLERLYTDPSYGGKCVWEINSPLPVLWPRPALPLGYLLSALVGASLILCGFNTLASKVASFYIGIIFLIVAFNLMLSPLGLVLTILTVGLMVGLWFIEHAMYLRYYVLFVGIMCCWYIIWDFIDDFVFHKINPCCAVLHSEILGIAPFIILYAYLAITALIFASFLIIAIYVFRQSSHSMFCQGQSFLPT